MGTAHDRLDRVSLDLVLVVCRVLRGSTTDSTRERILEQVYDDGQPVDWAISVDAANALSGQPGCSASRCGTTATRAGRYR